MGLVNSYTLILLPITFLVIFLTNITTTFMFFFTERNKLKEESLNEESSQKDSSQEEETNPYSLIKKSNKNKDSKEKIDAN
jgi:hypothetical protein